MARSRDDDATLKRLDLIHSHLWQFTPGTPVGVLQDYLRDRGLEDEADWLSNHAVWLETMWKRPSPEIVASRAFRSLKAAKLSGFHVIRSDEYGGEQVKIKGRTLVRNPKIALSQTSWRKLGRVVIPNSKPHAEMSFNPGKRVEFAVYREDQTTNRRANRASKR